MNPTTKSLADIFAFNTRMVRLGLDDLTDEQARHQMRDGSGSSIAFLAGHLLAARLGALKTLGLETSNPYREHFGSNVAATNGAGYPRIDELAAQWNSVAERFTSALSALGDEELLAPYEGFPVADKTVRGALMFWAWHESYHVGQIGLIRTELGNPPLRSRLRSELELETSSG